MSKTAKNKEQSPLVQSVLALDEHFSNLERLSNKIGETNLKSETDIEYVRQLMRRFAEHGEAVSKHIVELAGYLSDARARAEAAASVVSAKADLLQSRQSDEETKKAAFQALAEKVSALGQSIQDLRRPEGTVLTEEERSQTFERLSHLREQLKPLIDEAQSLKNDARDSKLSGLESQAESLTQHLINVDQTLATLSQSQSALH